MTASLQIILGLVTGLVITLPIPFAIMYTKRNPMFILRKIQSSIKKKKMKVKKQYSNKWESSFFPFSRIVVDVFSNFVWVKVELFGEKIFLFQYNQETKEITSFDCHEKMHISKQEDSFLSLLNEIILHVETDILKVKTKNEEISDFLKQSHQIKIKKETLTIFSESSNIQYRLFEIKTLTDYLLSNKVLLEQEKIYYIETISENRIPSILRQYEQLSDEKKDSVEREIVRTFDDIIATYKEWKSAVETMLSGDLKKELETLKQVIKS